MDPLGGLSCALYTSPHRDSRAWPLLTMPQGQSPPRMRTPQVRSTTFGSGLRPAGGEPQASP